MGNTKRQIKNFIQLFLIVFVWCFLGNHAIYAQGMGVGIAAPISVLHVYENTANTGTSTGLTIEQNSTGDAVIQYLLTGGQRWVEGIDNSDGDKFKISSTVDVGSTPRLTIQTTGEVGIGVTTPTCLLNLQAASPMLFINGNSGAAYAATLRFGGESYTDWRGGYIQYDGTANALRLGVHNTVDLLTASDNPIINIDRATGNVGIGTTAPLNPLEIKNTIDAFTGLAAPANYFLSIYDASATTGRGTGIAFANTSATTNVGAAIIFKRTGGSSQGELQFYSRGAGADGTLPIQAMVIDDGQKVGIGQTAPSTNARLDVKDGHFASDQTTAPTIVVTTQNAITAAAITAGSTDTKGNITTTGTNNGTNTVLTITFNMAYASAPIVVITAANANAQACTYFVSSSTTTFTLTFKNGGATPSFNYLVLQ